MILLDTNVVSEALKSAPNPKVVAWMDAQILETLFVSTITVTELRYGVAVLPEGKRKEGLKAALDEQILPLFGPRILAFDLEAAEICAQLRAQARTAGQGIGTADSYVAAIAAARQFAVATRDVHPFEAVGLSVINPWEVE